MLVTRLPIHKSHSGSLKPTVLTYSSQEPILKENVRAIVLNVSCSQGRNSRTDALQQPFLDRAHEDAPGGANHHNAVRRRDEIRLLVPLVVHSFPNRTHLYVKIKVDFMSYYDLRDLFGVFSSSDSKITLKEICTIQEDSTDQVEWSGWSRISDFNVAYSEVSQAAAKDAGQSWLLLTDPTSSVQWRPLGERQNLGETLWTRTTVWDGIGLDRPSGHG